MELLGRCPSWGFRSRRGGQLVDSQGFPSLFGNVSGEGQEWGPSLCSCPAAQPSWGPHPVLVHSSTRLGPSARFRRHAQPVGDVHRRPLFDAGAPLVPLDEQPISCARLTWEAKSSCKARVGRPRRARVPASKPAARGRSWMGRHDHHLDPSNSRRLLPHRMPHSGTRETRLGANPTCQFLERSMVLVLARRTSRWFAHWARHLCGGGGMGKHGGAPGRGQMPGGGWTSIAGNARHSAHVGRSPFRALGLS